MNLNSAASFSLHIEPRPPQPSVTRIWLCYDTDGSVRELSGGVGAYLRPDWLDEELNNSSWPDILSLGWQQEMLMRWGLTHGIAPNQPFLLELDAPHVYSTQSESGTEYDVEYTFDIVRVRRWPPARVALAFERWMEDERKYREANQRFKEKLAFLQRTDVKSMFLTSQHYYGTRYIDDMAPPGGIRWILRTSATLAKPPKGKAAPFPDFTASLVDGEDDAGDSEAAFRRLIERAVKVLPGLSAETIRALPRRTSW